MLAGVVVVVFAVSSLVALTFPMAGRASSTSFLRAVGTFTCLACTFAAFLGAHQGITVRLHCHGLFFVVMGLLRHLLE